MRRRGCCGPLLLILLFVLVVFLVFASLAAALVLRGEVPIYAPRLTGLEPHLSEPFLPTTPISLTFDQPMDAASVQAAFLLQPPVEGSFQWSADHTQVTFVPAGAGWEPGTTYSARLEAGAEAAMFSRVTARPVAWSFSLPPLLRSVSPAPDAGDVGAMPLLQAEFQYDLDCDLTLRTFVVEPDVTGELSCEGRTVAFSPTLPLEPGTAYAARVAHVFLESDPNLRPGVEWQLQTAPPLAVDDVKPGPQALVSDFWSGVRLLFTRPVVAGSVLSRFSLVDGTGQAVPGQARWEAEGAAFVYQPDEPLRPEAAYHVALQAGVRDELGFRLAQPLALDFTTLGLVGLPEPIPGTEGVALDSQVRIPFSRPMDRASVEAGLAFTPTLAGEITWEGDTLVLTPRDGLAGGVTYSVRLSPDVRDATGVPLSERKEWPFSTEPFLLGWQVPSGTPSGTAVRQLQQPLTLTFALPMDA
ncbi:MAG: Ig-like domain-containing protein, partial [Anaerolineae bacterium]